MENLNRRWGYLTGPTAVNFASVSVGLTRLDQDRFEVTYDPGTTQLGAQLTLGLSPVGAPFDLLHEIASLCFDADLRLGEV